VQAPIGNTGLSVYGGVDYGHVYGPSTVNIIGRQLAGAVIGLRGGWAARFGSLSYDLFAGTPICKPAGFTTANITTGFQVTYQY
jgi:hemolysin activation/secretion protein